MPSDQRSLTGRLCGDPQPGASALERQRQRDAGLFATELRSEMVRLAAEADLRFGGTVASEALPGAVLPDAPATATPAAAAPEPPLPAREGV